MSVPRYDSYRDSGVEWLGEVPSHWTVPKLKQLATFIGGSTPSRDKPEFWNGEIPWVSPKDMKSEALSDSEEHLTDLGLAASAANLVRSGAVLMVVRSGILRHTIPVAVNLVPVALNQDMKAVSFDSGRCLPWFFLRWVQGFNTALINAVCKQGATVESIEHDYLREVQFPLPPPSEQAAIAAFLDRETAKIDALVEEQRRLIALLAEKRQAVISHAVTKGLDPTVPMKESGVEWLGEVPAHWEVLPLRRLLFDITQGWSPECLGRPADGQEWGVLKAGCVNGGVFNAEENKSLPETLEPKPEYEVQLGDILMSRASGSPALVGACAFVHQTPPRILMSDKIYRIRLLRGHDAKWFSVLMNSSMMRAQIVAAISGAEGLANNLPQASLKAFHCVVPPPNEQAEIVNYVDIETEKLTALIFAAEEAITLLQERRAALISAAVTGKIDVRGLVPAVEEAA